LGLEILENLLQPGTTIGMAIKDAKQDLKVNFNKLKDVLIGWTLLGDPALVVVK